MVLRDILGKLRPEPSRDTPLPPPRRYEPPSKGRHAISASDPRVEFVNFARHHCRREPVDKDGRIQEGRAELLGPGPDDPRCASRGANMLFGHVAALARGRADQTAAFSTARNCNRGNRALGSRGRSPRALVSVLGSPGSVANRSVLFAGLPATTTESDFSGIIGYSSSPSRCGPAVSIRGPNPRSPGSRAKSFPTCQGLRPRRVGQSCFRGSMAGLCAPLPTLRPHPHGCPRTA
jgi:hypothetical protein